MTDATIAVPPEPRPARRRGFLLPVVLIVLGGVFLAGNFGYIPPVSWRALVQLWPLVLILWGIELLLARREPFLALGIEVLVILVAVGLVVSQPRGLFLPLTDGGSSSATIARDGASTLALRVDGGAGSYTVSGGASALVEARSAGGEIGVRDTRRGDAAEVRVQPSRTGDGVVFGRGVPATVNVLVASDVSTSLRVSGGAGDFTIDLREVQVRDARIETGASKLDLTLPKPSGDVPVRIQAGAASITIVVPDDVEARFTTAGGLLSTTIENARLGAGTSSAVARNASSMETPGYAAAKDRVTVSIEAGASSITVR